jgi:predicted metal-binding protein
MSKTDFEPFCQMAKDMGATGAKVISPQNVVTAAWVRLKCQYGCGGYGKRLTCPPYSPTPEETRKILDSYKHAILLRGDSNAEASDVAVKLEREIFLRGYYKAFAMGSGPCKHCQQCDTSKLCNHPYKARPAMEASGIDVFHTARSSGFSIDVVTSHEQKGDYYGLVLID